MPPPRAGTRAVTVVADVPIRTPGVFRVLLAGTLTAGIATCILHARTMRDLARLGRARGRMPFPYVEVNAAASTWALATALVLWLAAGIGSTILAVEIAGGAFAGAPGERVDTSVVPVVASLAALYVPAWLTGWRAGLRMRTAHHLVGVEPGRIAVPVHAALAATLFPPAYGAVLALWRRRLAATWEPPASPHAPASRTPQPGPAR